MSRWLLCFSLALGLSGCSSTAATKPKLPYDAWYLGFLAPNYMEVWLEQANVGDNSGRIFPNAMGGVVAMGEPVSLSATAKGWPKRIGSGAGRYLTGLDLPYVVSLRWQSMVEPRPIMRSSPFPIGRGRRWWNAFPPSVPAVVRSITASPSPSA